VAASIFGPLADAGINVDMIVQNVSEDGRRTDLTFTCGRSELDRALDAIRKAAPRIGYKDLVSDAGVAKVSIIGMGMRAHPGVAQTMFKTLAEKGINIQVISTSEIKVSVLIAEDYVELAVRALHSAYGLDTA
jgi:aspartate kinase